jgi:hypothetical protein
MSLLIYTDEQNEVQEIHLDPRVDHDVYIKRFIERGHDDCFIIDKSKVPDLSYRKSYSINNSEFETDITKAKDIHKEMIRHERSYMWKELDQEYLFKLSTDKDLTEVKAKQKKMRDITDDVSIGNAETIDDLKKITMTELLK